MYDLLTIGSATLDIIVASKEFILTQAGEGVALCERYGDKMDVETLKFTSGGGGTNVAVGGARLGLKTAVVAEIGKDFAADIVIKDLHKEKVDTQFLVAERLEETAVSVLLVSSEGGRSILTHRGAAYELESRDIPWENLKQTRWVHLGSLGGDKQLIFDLLEFFKSQDIGLSWTPSKSDLQLLIDGQIQASALDLDALILNGHEWESLADLRHQLSQQIGLVFVTRGKDGGEVLSRGAEILKYQALAVKSVEETGAGDAFASGVIAGIITGQPLPTCVEWGKKNAASVIQHYGAKEGLMTRQEIEK